MKKKLVVLLAVVMMFAFAATAYAADFTDISEQPVVVQDAVAKTTALGIIEGYTDGTFGPEQNITRAEFAKIAVTAAGAKDTATMLEKNASSFKDVKAGVWYTGWINASESLGIFQGDGNGNFRPNDSISNQEVVTVLMRLLGYNDNLTGTWPTNYITQANKDGILDNVAIVAAAAAKRADVVVMLDDTLDTNIVTYDKDTNEFVDKQIGISQSDLNGITLLEDSFNGSFAKYSNFNAITQVRDAAKETLTWNVGTLSATGNNRLPNDYDNTVIIDKDTKVSHNAASMFDLENHRGKVYFVEENDKYYARFIEVESYTKTSSDPVVMAKSGNKAEVGKTTYNLAYGATKGDVETGPDKNSNFVLYFNDDDQLYKAVSDQSFGEKAYYVKSVGNANVKLVAGAGKTTTANMKDDETLIWTGDEFIAPSELKVGDALLEITKDELYVKIDEVTGEMTKVTSSDKKATIGGKTYVFANDKELQFMNAEFENEGAVEDVVGNNVKYILNKNNSIAAIIIDETSLGTNLYGIVVDVDNAAQTLAQKTGYVVIFTAEGKTVTYELDVDAKDVPKEPHMGKMVEYQLDKDGVIDKLTLIDGSGDKKGEKLINGAGKVEIKNDAYLVGNKHTVTLAKNVVIFEVGKDGSDIDPSLVNRSSLLSGGDFEPGNLTGLKNGTNNNYELQYAIYVTNSNGAAKALAYTDANSTNFHYGVVSSWDFRDSDGEHRITFTGDDTTYKLTDNSLDYNNDKKDDANKVYKAENDALMIYTLNGSKVEIVKAYVKKTGVEKSALEVAGFNDGLMTFDTDMTVYQGYANGVEKKDAPYSEIMTDNDTIVYVMNASTGKYEAGALEDISKGAWVYVPVVDDDGIADIVIVDEYTVHSDTED